MRKCVVSFFSILALMAAVSGDGYKETDINMLDKRDDGLISTLVNLLVQEKREREDIMQRFDTMKKSFKALTRSVKSLERNSNTKQSNLQDQVNDIKKKLDLNGIGRKHQVGFTARLKTNYGIKTGTIIFQHEISNVGSGFSMKTGRFTCKIPGIYVFILTITSSNTNAQAFILRNGGKVGYVVSSYNNGWNSGSTSVVLRLHKDDFVTVEAGGKFYFGSYTTFSGFLLFG